MRTVPQLKIFAKNITRRVRRNEEKPNQNHKKPTMCTKRTGVVSYASCENYEQSQWEMDGILLGYW